MKVWLIGVGNMSLDYSRVLQDIGCDITAVGRGQKSAATFREKTGISVILGGLKDYLETGPEFPDAAIVSVGVEQLAPTCKNLISYGIKKILIEKPAGMISKEITEVSKMALDTDTEVFVAYNRRFYAAVEKALEIIKDDGGVKSFNFEFTEWGHEIRTLTKAEGVKENWFLANSSHVVDLAFFLGGKPQNLCCFHGGELDWHSRSCIFAGSGITKKKALFSYQANWASPGRWGVEILTTQHRLYFRPMEKLQIQNIGSVAVNDVDVDYSYDEKFKPGLFKQVQAFLSNETEKLCSIAEQVEMLPVYEKMANY